MHKLDRHMLSVGSIRSASEGQQAPTAQKALGHFAAGFGEPNGFTREENLEDAVPLEEPLLDLGCELITSRHSANSWQWISDQHVDDAASAIRRTHEHRSGGLFTDFADDPRLFPSRRKVESVDGRIRIFSGDNGEKLAFVGDMQRVESQQFAGT